MEHGNQEGATPANGSNQTQLPETNATSLVTPPVLPPPEPMQPSDFRLDLGALQFLDIEAREVGDHEIEPDGDTEEPAGIELYPPKARKKKRSWVWEFFVAQGTESSSDALCKVCQRDGKHFVVHRHGGSTRDMIRHLKNDHQIYGAHGQPAVDSSSKQSSLPYPPRSREKAMITWAIVRWLLVDKRPFATISTEAFQDIFKLVDPRYEFPHRTTVAKHAQRMYAAVEDKLRLYLKDKW